MNPATQGTLLLAVGFVALRLVQTGAYLNYLKQSMGKWLLVAAVVLVLVGLVSIVRALFGRTPATHGHPMTRAAWLLLAPALVVIVLPSDPLGAFAADRRDVRQPQTNSAMSFKALPTSIDGAVEVGLREFVDRAYLDKERSLDGTRVRLTGFVASVEGAGDATFVLSRFVILCCAADAYPVDVSVFGDEAPPVDAWVVVTGKWRSPKSKVEAYVDPVEIKAESVRRIDRPENPYDPG